jgi:hypothetical protein
MASALRVTITRLRALIEWGDKGVDARLWLTTRGLDKMHFLRDRESMIELRSAFRKDQLAEQARGVSFSISWGETRSAIVGCCDNFGKAMDAGWAALAFVASIHLGPCAQHGRNARGSPRGNVEGNASESNST